MSEDNKKNQSPKNQNSDCDEASLKLQLLRTQVNDAVFKLQKAKRDDVHAAEEAELRLRQLRAQAEKAELELSNLKREQSKSLAEAQEDRTYTYSESVNDLTVKSAIADLGKLARRFPGEPLKFQLTSSGGSVQHGFALFDFLRSLSSSGHEITVVVLGPAASMGGILLQAGDKRVIGRHSMVLIHEVSARTSGKVSEMQDDVKFFERLWVQLSIVLADRAAKTGKKTLTAKQIRAKAKKFDWWLTAEEAVALGYADEIL